MAQLTEKTARDYVAQKMAAEQAVVIRSTFIHDVDGFVPVVEVYGSYEINDGTQTLPFHWSVWVDDGKFYGEW